MPAPELTTIRDNLLTAINALATGAQEYTIDGRTFKRADLDKLIDAYERIDARVRRRSRADNGVRHAEFNDATQGRRADGRC